MTQILRSSNAPIMPTDKRTFSGATLSSNRQVSGSNSQVGHKIKNFFRISSSGSKDALAPRKDSTDKSDSGASTPRGLRQSRFLPHIGSRNRSTTVASEGGTLDSMSPAATANPYFQHQGPPALRHHNDSSVPPSPTEAATPTTEVDMNGDAATGPGKDDLARKLRKVASAPNAQALFSEAQQKSTSQEPGPKPSSSPTKPITPSSLAIEIPNGSKEHLDLVLPVSNLSPGKIRESVAFRRTYSSNSIKVRNVEVGPGSFDKIKLIGKGDVGKVYLVREKKSSRLYAMKGE